MSQRQATYDALDRVVEQYNGSFDTEILYSPVGKTALMNGSTLIKAFVNLPGGATAVYNSSGLAYYRHSDHLGSSRLASTQARGLYSSTAYAPFGEPYATAGTADASFTGQNEDTVPSLYDFTFRKHSPSQGRWISPDPLGVGAVNPTNPQTWNRYAYVANNPLSHTDPLGLDEDECDPDTDDCGGGGGGSDPGFGDASGGWFWGGGPSGGPLADISNDCGGPCTPFVANLGNGCYSLVTYSNQTDSTGTWAIPSFGAPLCGGTGNSNVGGGGPLGGGGGGPQVPGSPRNLVERANMAFVQCVVENALSAAGQGAMETVSDASKNGEAPGTGSTILNMAKAALDSQNDCLGANPLADLSPNYQGLPLSGDLGVNPIVGGIIPY